MSFEPRLVVAAEDVERGAAHVVDRARIEQAVAELLGAIGEDPARAGLIETPRRVADSFADMFAGYGVDPVAVLEPLPDERGTGLIMVRDIQLISTCEHHLLPFAGSAAVAYLPGPEGRITGLSKLARVVDVLSRRLQVQERLVREVADAVEAALAPRAVFVLAEAEHMCMSARGARKPGSITVTTDVRGEWSGDAGARAELVALAHGAR